MKKRLLGVLLIVALIACTAAGCGQNGGSGSAGETTTAAVNKETVNSAETQSAEETEGAADLSSLTFGPYNWGVPAAIDYSQPGIKRFDGVEFTRISDTANMELPEGMSIDDNTYTWLFEAATGLKTKTEWVAGAGSPYTAKMNQAIASGEIPDLMKVDMTQYYALIKADLIADLTDELRSGNHPTLQKLYGMSDNKALDTLEVDGRIYGIPRVNAQFDSAPLIWIRKDWMEKLNLEEPKTLADLEKIALAFMESDFDGNGQKDTYGIPVVANFTSVGHSDGTLCDIFLNVGGAAPGIWQLQDDGTVIYGSLMEEAKEALTLLNSWYEKGIIPSDFATWEADTIKETIGNNRAGIALGPWWANGRFLINSLTMDEEAEWTAYMLPEHEGERVRSAGGNPVSDVYVVRKDVEDPSMFVYAYDIWCETPQIPVEYENFVEVSNSFNPMLTSVSPKSYLIPIRTVLDKVVGSGELSSQEEVKQACLEEAGVPLDWVVEGAFRGKSVYDAMEAGEDPRAVAVDDLDALNTYRQYLQWWAGPRAMAEADPEAVMTSFQGTTDSMEVYSSFLEAYEKEAYVNMIMGNTDGQSISEYFDAFVKSYLEQGGAAVTAEVQEALGN